MDNNSIPNNFDWRYYFKANPDVFTYYGHLGETGAKTHWMHYGFKENRKYCENQNNLPVTKTKNNEITIEKKDIPIVLENKDKLITIVVPNKFGEDPSITINSLYKQTFQNFDIIVINDLEGNANKARNEGFSKVKTPYVLFSDNDISWNPTALEDLYYELVNDSSVSFTYGSWSMENILHSNEPWNEEKLKKSNYISTMSLIRTSDHPGFDENIKRFQDWDVWLTMIEQGKKGKFIGKEVFSTKKRNGISNNSISSDEANLVIRKKHFLKKKDNQLISFIVPIKGREEHVDGLEYNIKKYFEDYNYEIVYVNQKDESLFMRGQLCNIGFKECNGDVIIFQDVDIRHLRKINPYEILNNFNSAFVAFDEITQLYEKSIGQYELLETEKRLDGWGGCAIFYRDQFISCGGFSNLVFGWGAEDNIIGDRVKLKRFNQNLGHVYHESLRKDDDVHKSQYYLNNKSVWKTDKKRDPHNDGYEQTTCNITKENKTSNITILNVKDIGVSDNYKYMDLFALYSKENIKKLKILLLPDSPGWAFDNIASAIIKYNPYPDKISYTKIFVKEVKSQKKQIDLNEWDIIYLMFEGEDCLPNDNNKIIRGCYSFAWVENPNNTPQVLGERFSQNAGVVFVNDIIQKHISPFISENIKKIVIYDSSDETIFYPIENKKLKEFTAIFVGNINRKVKNYPIIKEICKKSNINLIVAHDIPHDKLINEYNKADLCINFSDSEGGPQTFIESALCGVPMLIKDDNSLSNKIPCFVGKTENDFITLINFLKVNREKCKEIGMKARETALNEYTYKKTSKTFADFFLSFKNK